MKKKILSFLLVLSLLVTLIVPFTVTTVSADGTAITNQSGLASMSATGNYYLANDITISGSWSYDTVFKGTLDGKGHTIEFASGTAVGAGLFKYVSLGATIKNLNIVSNTASDKWSSARKSADGYYQSSQAVAGLTASIFGKEGDKTQITIQNVTVTANISSGADYNGLAMGGLIGEIRMARVSITNCAFNGSITSTGTHSNNASGFGGIVGKLHGATYDITISQCVNNGSISGYQNVGGILGNSHNSGKNDSVTISKCINRGAITSTNNAYAGGIVGVIKQNSSGAVDIVNNINYGNVAASTSGATPAGICGAVTDGNTSYDRIKNNVNYGTITGGTPAQILGQGTATQDKNYTSSTAASTIVSNLTSTNSTVAYIESNSKAALVWKVTNQNELSQMNPLGSYMLANDITISGTWDYGFIFKGTLDGNGKTITFASGATIYGGLFQFMSIGATVKDLNIVANSATWRTVAKSFTGYYASTGAIGAVSATIFGADGPGSTEANKITIQNVNVTASITVTESVNSSKETVAAGLVGYVRYANAIFQNCNFYGSITVPTSFQPSSNSAFGGIVGMIAQRTYKAQFVECINEANISAPCNVGGIVGWSRVWGGENAQGTGIDYLRIQYCMNRGNITCTGAYSGGQGYKDVGGIIGYAHGVNKSTTLILNNINYGAVSFTGSATAYPGGICGRARYYDGIMEYSGNINYGTVSVVTGATAPILNWNENQWRLDGIEKDDTDIAHLNNYATAGQTISSGYTLSGNEGQMAADGLIGTSSYSTYVELKKAYPDVYTMTGSGKISLIWELGDLSYQVADSYGTYMSLALDGTIQLRIGIGADCVVPSDKGVTLTVEKDNVQIKNCAIHDALDSTSGYFVVSDALTAKEMADNHTYKVTIKEGSTTIKSSTFTASIKTYANAILGESNYSAWHELMTAMLNYGAATQTYFNYNTSNLAGSTNISFGTTGLPSVTKVSGDATFIDKVSGSMNLNSGTDMNLYVKPVNTGNTLTASVKDSANITVSGVTCTKITSGDLNGSWLIKIPNLSADRLSETFNITVSNGSKSVVFSYSALCWVNEVLNTEDTNHVTNNMKLLARGIGAYANAAQVINTQSQPLLFASQGISPYVVSYSASASDYLKSTALSVAKNMNKDNVKLSATTAPEAGQRVVELKTSSAVSSYKIEYENDGDVIITGNNDRWAALGVLEFFNVLLKSNSNGDYIISNPQTYTPSNAANYTRDGWLLAAPAYAAGTLSSGMYDAGTGLSADKNAPDAERSYMMSISGTTAVQFNTYKNRLTSCGYTLVASNTNSSNQFYQYKKGDQLIYCYFVNSTKVVRVIDDRASTPEDEFEYTFTNSSSTATDLVMYGMYYTPDGYTVNNGEFNIIKQADGSVILIDGGKAEQATDGAITGLWNYLRNLTGNTNPNNTNNKIKIACWFVTHPHGDHYALVSALINKYHDYLDLQRVMFNFPNAAVVGTGVVGTIRDAARQYFPDTMFLKCHTGQKITLGSLTMDIMTAQEDLVNTSTGTTGTLSDGNLLTSVCRFTFADGTKYMELGDLDEDRQDALLGMYNASEFSCKVTSVAHHGYNNVSSVYAKIGARYAFLPNYTNTNFDTSVDGGSWRKNKITYSVNALKSANSSVTVDYAGLNTVKLTCQSGNITRTTSSVVR